MRQRENGNRSETTSVFIDRRNQANDTRHIFWKSEKSSISKCLIFALGEQVENLNHVCSLRLLSINVLHSYAS